MKSAETITLSKESAVLIIYALPVSQYGSGTKDANTWDLLAKVEARVVVDGSPYSQSVQSVSGSSRTITKLNGELPLILAAGTHTITIEWQADKIQWTTMDPSLRGTEILAIISSENAKPSIELPVQSKNLPTKDGSRVIDKNGPIAENYAYVQTNEDTPLQLDGISIADVDSTLSYGMQVHLNISVTYGDLALLEPPLNMRSYTKAHGHE